MPLPKKKKTHSKSWAWIGSVDRYANSISPRRFLLWLSGISAWRCATAWAIRTIILDKQQATQYQVNGLCITCYSAWKSEHIPRCRCAHWCVWSWMVLIMTQHNLSEIHHLGPIFSWAVWQIVKPPVWSKCCHMNPEGTTQQRWHWSFLSDTFRFAILHLFLFFFHANTLTV